MGAVVFDCDGVLVDSEPHSLEAWREVLARLGHPGTAGDVRECTGLGYVACHERLATLGPLPPPGELWPELLAALHRSFAAGLEVHGDARATVEGLVLRGIPVAVASSSPRQRLDLTLGCAGLGGRFDVTVAGDEVPRSKPWPDVYLEAARRLGVPPPSCVAVEDTGHGARAARAAGMRVVGVVREPGEAGALLAGGAALVSALDADDLASWVA